MGFPFFIGAVLSFKGGKMEITKRQALSLIKVLSHYCSITTVGSHYAIVADVEDLISQLEDFVLRSDDVDSETYIRVDNEIDSDTLTDLRACRSHVVSSSVGEPGSDTDLWFKRVINEDGTTDTLLLTTLSKDPIGPVTYVRLNDRELQVATGFGFNRTWHYFDLEIISDEWLDAFGEKSSFLRVVNWR